MLFAYVDETGDIGSVSKRGSSACYSLGCLLIDADGWSKATAAIKQLSSRIIGLGDEDSEEAAHVGGGKKSLLGSFDIKSLLAKKDKGQVEEA